MWEEERKKKFTSGRNDHLVRARIMSIFTCSFYVGNGIIWIGMAYTAFLGFGGRVVG